MNEMKRTILSMTLAFVVAGSFAQKKTTTSAMISFDATTSLDALPKAENTTAVAALDTKEGTVAFEALIKNFSFSNPMMQDHFNQEKWMNSDKFPKAVFKGTITNLSNVNFSKDGAYTANVEGNLTIHGVTKPVKTTANVTVKEGAISTHSDLTVMLADYDVKGGAIDAGKVSNETKIRVVADFK